MLTYPRIFPPDINSHPVRLIEQKLGTPHVALSVPYEAVAEAKEQFCFQNVKHIVEQLGGELVYGWLVWQHGKFFVEAEHHAVWRTPTGDHICVTPQTPPEEAVTFIPDPSSTFDWNSGVMKHNVRVALVDDSRILAFFGACEEQTDIINKGRLRAAKPSLVELTAEQQWRLASINSQKAELMSSVLSSESRFQGVGRNEPCPCGSGKKYKKCHGA